MFKDFEPFDATLTLRAAPERSADAHLLRTFDPILHTLGDSVKFAVTAQTRSGSPNRALYCTLRDPRKLERRGPQGRWYRFAV